MRSILLRFLLRQSVQVRDVVEKQRFQDLPREIDFDRLNLGSKFPGFGLTFLLGGMGFIVPIYPVSVFLVLGRRVVGVPSHVFLFLVA